MGECLAYSSLQAYSKVKFAARPTSWQPPVADLLLLRGPTVNLRIWLCIVDDSTVYYYSRHMPGLLNDIHCEAVLSHHLCYFLSSSLISVLLCVCGRVGQYCRADLRCAQRLSIDCGTRTSSETGAKMSRCVRTRRHVSSCETTFR